MISRSDLSPGLQAAQAAHAALAFSLEHADLARRWHEGSNCLVLLSAEDEADLLALHGLAETADVPRSLFREPDIGNEFTAFAVVPARTPGSRLNGMLASLPLQGRERAVS